MLPNHHSLSDSTGFPRGDADRSSFSHNTTNTDINPHCNTCNVYTYFLTYSDENSYLDPYTDDYPAVDKDHR